MDRENTKKLFESYPKLFPANERSNPSVSLMCFGFECRDGWFNLLNSLCKAIQDHLDANPTAQQVVVKQVKEKYGALRFYFDGGDKFIDDLVDAAEKDSFHICDTCGTTKNLLRQQGWVRVTCQSCIAKDERAHKRVWRVHI